MSDNNTSQEETAVSQQTDLKEDHGKAKTPTMHMDEDFLSTSVGLKKTRRRKRDQPKNVSPNTASSQGTFKYFGKNKKVYVDKLSDMDEDYLTNLSKQFMSVNISSKSIHNLLEKNVQREGNCLPHRFTVPVDEQKDCMLVFWKRDYQNEGHTEHSEVQSYWYVMVFFLNLFSTSRTV